MNLKNKICKVCRRKGFTKTKNNYLVCIWCGSKEKQEERKQRLGDIDKLKKELNID